MVPYLFFFVYHTVSENECHALENKPYVNGVTLTGEIVFNMILVSWLEIDISYETTLIVYGSLRIF